MRVASPLGLPVVTVVRVSGAEAAVRVANDTEYGLACSADIARALGVAMNSPSCAGSRSKPARVTTRSKYVSKPRMHSPMMHSSGERQALGTIKSV